MDAKDKTKPKRYVAAASRMERGLENSLLSQRTAVFDENTTLAQVFDGLRCKGDAVEILTKGGDWWNAPLSIHEDYTTPEPHPLLRAFLRNDKTESAPSAELGADVTF